MHDDDRSGSFGQWMRTAQHLTPGTARLVGGSLLVFVCLLGGTAMWFDDAVSMPMFNEACETIAPGTAGADVLVAMNPAHWVGRCDGDCGSFTGHDGLPYEFRCEGMSCSMVFDNGARRCTVPVGRTSASALGAGALSGGG